MLNFDTIAVCSHVVLGTLAVLMGAIAFAAPKGRRTHVICGRVFVVSMGLSSILGAFLGAMKFETFWITFHAGILGATLVTSGVLAVQIRNPRIKPWFGAVAAINALNAASLFGAGFYATKMPEGQLFGFHAGDYFFLFGMSAIAAFGDFMMLRGAPISHKHRIAQHLTRMCIGFFIAAGSAFTGPGSTAFPEAVQQSGILSLPELTIFLLTIFWLWKTLRKNPMGTLKPTM